MHRSIQELIISLLPPGEAVMEKKIGSHRADVFWEAYGIVFEIQCSPISLEEAIARSHGYREKGLSLVWLLHGKYFNRRILTPSELYLRTLSCYYVDKRGFYDQWEVLKGNKRIFRSSPLWINLKEPIKSTNLSFQGDRSTQCFELQEEFIQRKNALLETSLLSRFRTRYDVWLAKLVKKFSL